MLINKAYKTKLNPTRNQIKYFEQCGRVRRTVFNFMLAQYNSEYKAWYTAREKAKASGIEFPRYDEEKESAPAEVQVEAAPKKKRKSAEEIKQGWASFDEACKKAGIEIPPFPKKNSGRNIYKKALNEIKARDTYAEDGKELVEGVNRLRFLVNYPYTILQEAADDFDKAMKRYTDMKKSGEVARLKNEHFTGPRSVSYRRRHAKMIDRGYVGNQLDPIYPQYKSRFDDKQNFRLLGSITIEERRIKLPKIGWVKLAEYGYIPTNPIKISSATISRENEVWYISVGVEEESHETAELNPITLGVSIGVMDLAATSTGDVHENPRVFFIYEERKAKLQRELSRREHKTEDGKVDRTRKNWNKTKKKIAKLDQKISRARKHHQHNASKKITDTMPETVILKDMEVQEMQKNSNIAKSLADAGMGEVSRQIAYKGAWNGTNVIKTKEAVSGYCSRCGSHDTTINYSTKTFHCLSCDLRIRGSINTAINLTKVGEQHAEHVD